MTTTATDPRVPAIEYVRRTLFADTESARHVRETLFEVNVSSMSPGSDFDAKLLDALRILGLLRWEKEGCVIAERRIMSVRMNDNRTVRVFTDFPPSAAERRNTRQRCWPYSDEAETIVSDLEILLSLQPENASVLDMCTGVGTVAICMALLRPDLRIVAVDNNPKALELARLNEQLNGVSPGTIQWLCSDLFDAITDDQEFDVIVADPPFNLVPETKQTFESGGPQGDAFTKRILESIPLRLKRSRHARFVFLTYSLCISTSVKDVAIQRLVPGGLRVEFTFAGPRVWRYEYRKAFPNPARIWCMLIRLGDKTYPDSILDDPPDKQTDTLSRWSEWIERLETKGGFTHLHYVKGVGQWDSSEIPAV